MVEVLYKSTRGTEKGITASSAILKGLSSDGGLFVPEVIYLWKSLRKCPIRKWRLK